MSSLILAEASLAHSLAMFGANGIDVVSDFNFIGKWIAGPMVSARGIRGRHLGCGAVQGRG
jgi:hypothetical protein